MRIYQQKAGDLTQADMLELLKLLGKAGYVVRIGKERQTPKSTWVRFVEFREVFEHGEHDV